MFTGVAHMNYLHGGLMDSIQGTSTNRREEFKMEWWSGLSKFWQGFICGGVAVPLGIVFVEIIVKLGLKRT